MIMLRVARDIWFKSRITRTLGTSAEQRPELCHSHADPLGFPTVILVAEGHISFQRSNRCVQWNTTSFHSIPLRHMPYPTKQSWYISISPSCCYKAAVKWRMAPHLRICLCPVLPSLTGNKSSVRGAKNLPMFSVLHHLLLASTFVTLLFLQILHKERPEQLRRLWRSCAMPSCCWPRLDEPFHRSIKRPTFLRCRIPSLDFMDKDSSTYLFSEDRPSLNPSQIPAPTGTGMKNSLLTENMPDMRGQASCTECSFGQGNSNFHHKQEDLLVPLPTTKNKGPRLTVVADMIAQLTPWKHSGPKLSYDLSLLAKSASSKGGNYGQLSSEGAFRHALSGKCFVIRI